MREIEGQQVAVYEDNFDFHLNKDGTYYLCMVLTFMLQIGITARYKSYISFGDEYILSYDVGLYALSVNFIFIIIYFILKLDGISTQEFKNINSEIIKLSHEKMTFINKFKILSDTIVILTNNTKFVYTEIVFKILLIINNSLILIIIVNHRQFWKESQVFEQAFIYLSFIFIIFSIFCVFRSCY